MAEALAWVSRKYKPEAPIARGNPIRIADFFCGAGGLTLGSFEAARRVGRTIDIRAAIDCDRIAIAVYRKNFAEYLCAIGQGDINELIDGNISAPLTPKEQAVQQRCGKLDTLLSGPPCQGHSDLNNSTRRDDPRNKLYLRAVRAVEVLRPKFAFIENVPAVVHDKFKVVDEATRVLARIGYGVTSAIIDMQAFGLPQRRRRHILFAAENACISISDLIPKPCGRSGIPLGPFIAGLEDETSDSLIHRAARITEENARRVNYLFKHRLYDLPDAVRPSCHRDKPHSYQSVYGRLRWGRPAQTITSGFGSPGQGRFIHPRRKRLITPHEAARIQGFPDFYDFEPAGGLTALRTMIGNAVPPPMMIAMMGSLLNRGQL
jgi:DNA (cytosine-5)-methyltransferase 1